jgi:hypothetical protein
MPKHERLMFTSPEQRARPVGVSGKTDAALDELRHHAFLMNSGAFSHAHQRQPHLRYK